MMNVIDESLFEDEEPTPSIYDEVYYYDESEFKEEEEPLKKLEYLNKCRKEIESELNFDDFKNLLIKQMVLERKMTMEQIGAQFFPPISITTVSNIAKKMGVQTQIRKRGPSTGWTPEEDEKLILLYKEKTPLYVLCRIFHRTQMSIMGREFKLGLKRSK